MKRIIGILVFALFGFSGLLKAQIVNESILLVVGNDTITRGEFLQTYNKNSGIGERDLSKVALERYLDMFINFRLKVQAAEVAGFDTNTAIQNELLTYRHQLAEPYMRNDKVEETLVKEAYEYMEYDLLGRHILIYCKKKAAPKDTLIAYNKAMEVYNKLQNGANFSDMALKYSYEIKNKIRKGYTPGDNEGSLGYFTAFTMAYPFEKVAYNLKLNEISKPVRTGYGYHVIQITDKKPSLGKVNISHILFVHRAADTTKEAIEKKKLEIATAYYAIEEGLSFEEAAAKYSDDKASARKGGNLGEFPINRMIPEIIAALYDLEEGEVSKPIKTKSGWHLVKLISKTGVLPFSEVEKEIEYRIVRDKNRINLPIFARIQELLQENGFEDFPKNLALFENTVDKTALPHNKFKYDSSKLAQKIYSKPIFKYGNTEVIAADFAEFLATKLEVRVGSPEVLYAESYRDFKYMIVLKQELSEMETKYPEFAALIKEYRDGVYLFDISNMKVWAKAATDTVGLRKYYEDNKETYKWPKQLDAIIYSYDVEHLDTEKLGDFLHTAYAKKWNKEVIKKNADKKFGEDILGIEEGKYYPKTNAFVDNMIWEVGLSKDIFSGTTRKAYVYVNDILPEKYKEFAEIKGTVTSDYQGYLDRKWVEEMRKATHISVDKKVFDSMIKGNQ